ncbi:hypothetical protein G6F68_012718 [Rhizopus microsporus]|nr:hypothetical protein G6F68_012718 [Rhizopus microsporus]
MLGQVVADLLRVGQQFRELRQDAAGQRDVTGFDHDAGSGGVGIDDRQQRLGGQERGFVGQRVEDLGHGGLGLCSSAQGKAGAPAGPRATVSLFPAAVRLPAWNLRLGRLVRLLARGGTHDPLRQSLPPLGAHRTGQRLCAFASPEAADAESSNDGGQAGDFICRRSSTSDVQRTGARHAGSNVDVVPGGTSVRACVPRHGISAVRASPS